MYYIRRKSNQEQYLVGTPSFHTWNIGNGRLFNTIGKLRSFITNVLRNEYRRKFIGDWEIVEVEVVQKDVKELNEIIKPEKIMELLKE
jgi:hypothetical protein